jgi:hypothetical protein
MGVRVSAGAHRVVLERVDRPLCIGAWITLASLVLLLAVELMRRASARKVSPARA